VNPRRRKNTAAKPRPNPLKHVGTVIIRWPAGRPGRAFAGSEVGIYNASTGARMTNVAGVSMKLTAGGLIDVALTEYVDPEQLRTEIRWYIVAGFEVAE
jgi:hypothetical protein